MAYPRYVQRRKRRRVTRYGSRYIGRVRGRGGYYQDVGKLALHHGGGFLGGAIGGLVPGLGGIGSQLGSWAGDRIAKIAGLGAYQVKSNSLMMPEGHQIPAFGDLSDAVVIKHREYITDIVVPATPAAFTNQAFVLNPGLAATFPWLSNIAESFDSYMWLGIIFEFRSTSADIGSATSLGMGTVIMATDYDAHDPAYPTKLAMENAQYTTSGKPSESITHVIECDPSVTAQPHLFVRQGTIPAGEDGRFYDLGLFQIATQGLPTGSTGTIGELWVTYQIAFFKPQLHANALNLVGFYYVSLTWDANNRWGLPVFTDDTSNNLAFVRSGNLLTLPSAVAGEVYFFNVTYHHTPQVYSGGVLFTGSSNCTTSRIQNSGAVGTGAVTEFHVTGYMNVTGLSPTLGLANFNIQPGQGAVEVQFFRVVPGLAS